MVILNSVLLTTKINHHLPFLGKKPCGHGTHSDVKGLIYTWIRSRKGGRTRVRLFFAFIFVLYFLNGNNLDSST